MSGLNEAASGGNDNDENDSDTDPLGILGCMTCQSCKTDEECSDDSENSQAERKWSENEEGRLREFRRRERAKELSVRFGPQLKPCFKFGGPF